MRTTRIVHGAEHWASYLINGDASGLSDIEKAECDAWCELELEPNETIVDCDEEPYFSWSYGFFTGSLFKGGNLLDYVVLCEKKD
jgi:hypothetical protein